MQKKVQKTIFSVRNIIIAFVILFIILLGIGIHKRGNNSSSLPKNIVTVHYGDIAQTAVAAGHVVPVSATQIKSQISGTAVKIFHDVGDYVKVGDPLIQVRPNPTPQDLIAAKQAVDNAKAVLNAAKEQYRRTHILFLKHLKSAQEDQRDQQAFAKSRNDYKASVQQYRFLTKGKTNLDGFASDAVVTSSVDGFILKRSINVGDSVVPISTYQAGTVLFLVADLNDMVFQGTVDEIDIKNIKKGMASQVVLASMPKDALKGEVSKIGVADLNYSNDDSYKLATNQGSRFSVTIDHLSIPKGTMMRAGYSATANIIVKQKKHVLLIPEYALHFSGSKTFVDVLKEGQVRKQMVTLGLEDGVQAEILSGLSQGDKVVVGSNSE